MIIDVIRGFFMALADSVPGVSGGTIAFLMGFFDKFINSLNYLLKGTKEEKIKSIKFLAKLFLGWIIGMGLAVTILANLFDKEIYKMSSLFLGFIIAAIPVMIIEEKETVKGKYINIIWAIVGALAVILLPSLKMGSNLDLTNLNIGMFIYIFIAGMLAISAMVLPGISGLAQVRGRNGISIFKKIEYDIKYVDNISFKEDVKIVFETIKTVFSKVNAEISEQGIKEEIHDLQVQNVKTENIKYKEVV